MPSIRPTFFPSDSAAARASLRATRSATSNWVRGESAEEERPSTEADVMPVAALVDAADLMSLEVAMLEVSHRYRIAESRRAISGRKSGFHSGFESRVDSVVIVVRMQFWHNRHRRIFPPGTRRVRVTRVSGHSQCPQTTPTIE
jgi:hypothetical protein